LFSPTVAALPRLDIAHICAIFTASGAV